ncbi:MAG: dicarboxylate/amino acid:cation symporter [Fimbriimonadales bacterium]|nr:dicarboxylate/amino acid:cation symporter [Fimbriimonadales bacterium]
MAGLIDQRFGLRVLLGILLGALLGGVLLAALPVGVQPGDTLELTAADGSRVQAKVDQAPDAGPGMAKVSLSAGGAETIGPLPLLGLPVREAAVSIGSAAGFDVASSRVASRGEVKIRPWPTEILHVVGQLFLRLLRMLVVPLIVVSVLMGIASLGSIKALGRLGMQAAFWMVGTMFVAVAIGLVLVNLIQPGKGLREQWAAEAGASAAPQQTVGELILRVVPTNPIEALANLDVVGILFFTIFVAVAMLHIGRERLTTVYGFFEGLNEVVGTIVAWVMRLAPLGIAALIATTVATQDPSFLGPILRSLGLFALTVTLALALHFLFQLAILLWVAKVSPVRFLQMMGPALATAFGTNSSNATLPVTVRCVEELGVPRRIYGFVLPVGATLNMDGTALFEAVAVMFFAQAFGADLGSGGQLLVAFTSVAAAMGAAGIPSAGLVTMVLVLSAVGLPATKLPLLWAIDRPLDMMRTAVNVSGDALTCCIVQRLNRDLGPERDEDDAG